MLYVFFRAWAFGRASAGNWYALDNYIYYADLSYGFNPSLLANAWVGALHLFPLISVVYESLILAIAATYAYSLGRRGQPMRVLAMMVLTGLLGMQSLSAAAGLWAGLLARITLLSRRRAGELRRYLCR